MKVLGFSALLGTILLRLQIEIRIKLHYIIVSPKRNIGRISYSSDQWTSFYFKIPIIHWLEPCYVIPTLRRIEYIVCELGISESSPFSPSGKMETLEFSTLFGAIFLYF